MTEPGLHQPPHHRPDSASGIAGGTAADSSEKLRGPGRVAAGHRQRFLQRHSLECRHLVAEVHPA
jgi:hypothetical protein